MVQRRLHDALRHDALRSLQSRSFRRPVTDSLNYDTIYTERYLGLLPEAAKAYDDTSEPKHAADLHGSLLLVHGTSDDNVHFQNTIQMIDALIKADKLFRLMIYPTKTHSTVKTRGFTCLA